MALIDLLVVGLVLAFVVSRFLKHDLPKDQRPKGERKFDWQEFTRRMTPAMGDEPLKPERVTKARKAKVVDVKGLSGVELLQATDETFEEERFKDGVAKAYRYFYQCWNAMDVDGLDKLCGPDLLGQLRNSLADYKKRGAKPEVVVNDISSVEILKASLKARTAVVEVRIKARQSEGEIKAGKTIANQALPHAVQSVWVLARALTSDDPNWELQSIKHEGAKA